jgi:site-specific DNA-methyltransferase (adenine-specific)
MEGLVHVRHDENSLEAKNLAGRQRSQLKETLQGIDSGCVFRERPELSPLVNWSSGKKAPFHRWIRYREAYSPDLVEALKLGDRILDPFCGCGSVLVGASQRNKEFVGIDLNPLATFAANVKLRHLSSSEFAAVHNFCSILPNFDLRADVRDLVPPLSIASKVFEPLILRCILNVRRQIISCSLPPASRDFLLLAWIAILEKVGSYFKEGNGIKYRRRLRRPGRYVERPEGIWQLQRFGPDQEGHVISIFLRHVEEMLEDAVAWPSMRGRGEVITGNALNLAELAPGHFDSIVFSPPYANRFDYFESMKVELWFGGFVQTSRGMQELRKNSLRSHLGANMKREKARFPELESLIEQMDRCSSSWRMGVPELLRGYFSDMVEVLRQCKTKLTTGGDCYIVVGNSAFAKVIIPSDSLTALAAKMAGFAHAEIWVTRHLSVSPQQRSSLSGFENFMRESIIVLRA